MCMAVTANLLKRSYIHIVRSTYDRCCARETDNNVDGDNRLDVNAQIDGKKPIASIGLMSGHSSADLGLHSSTYQSDTHGSVPLIRLSWQHQLRNVSYSLRPQILPADS